MTSRIKNIVLATMLFIAGIAIGLSLDRQEIQIKWAVYRYCVDESFLRAVLRFEDGRQGLEAGFDPIKWVNPKNKWQDIQAYSDPTMPEGAEQHCRLSRRLIIHLQHWVFNDEFRRREWLKEWAKNYHSGGDADYKEGRDFNNRLYYQTLKTVWAEERLKIKTQTYKPILSISQ